MITVIKFLKFICFVFYLGGGGGGRAKAIPASLGKSVSNATYCIGKTLEYLKGKKSAVLQGRYRRLDKLRGRGLLLQGGNS